VQLENATDFPDSLDLKTDDFLGSASLAFPETSSEVFGDLAIILDPGWYALVFGSGLFGTTGSGGAVLNNPDIGSPSYIAKVIGSGWLAVNSLPGPFRDYRFVVEGTVVPEPNTATLVLLGIALQRRRISGSGVNRCCLD